MTKQELDQVTAFRTFNEDEQFQSDMDSIIKYVYTKLGQETLQVELEITDIATSYEEACLEYEGLINLYQTRSVIPNLLGAQVSGAANLSGKYIKASLEAAKKIAQPFGGEALVGGNVKLHSGSIDLRIGQQAYDLDLLYPVPDGAEIEIREIFHFSPVAAYRFFDTSSAVNYLNNQFKFESFTPETIFYLLPIWEDVLRAQQLQMAAKIRRSNYSYNVIGNVLYIYPVPMEGKRLHFTYFLKEAITDESISALPDAVTSIADIPFGQLPYSRINSIGRQWIRRFCLALCKEILGYNRSKFGTVPIPNGDVTLNGADLVNNAKGEQDALREELKAFLEEMTYDKVMAREAEKAQALSDTLKWIPLKIYTG